ncbi:MAG: dTMP kinase [Ignavibacteriales bacterium]|nr:dTMP kinase [Ignavibacteriales bacterium]
MFISFEGIDFAGKTTQLEKLRAWFEERGENVETLREPGGTALGERIRELLLSAAHEDMTESAELFLFSAARAQLTRAKIEPALRDGRVVLIDRYYDSTTAYQGYGRGLPLDEIEILNRAATGGTNPDLTFILDLDFDASRRRQAERDDGATDRIESADRDFFERVRNGYLTIADDEPDRARVIDATGSIETIHEIVVRETERRYAERKNS